MTAPRRSRVPPGVRDTLRYSGIGITMAACVAAFTILGHWVDGFTQWRIPAFALVGSLFGIAGGLLYLFRATRKP